MKVSFTGPALRDVEEIIDYLGARSKVAADGLSKRIAKVVTLIGDQPEIGRATVDPTVRRFALAPYPYILFYERREDAIYIMALRHGARHPDSMPGGDMQN